MISTILAAVTAAKATPAAAVTPHGLTATPPAALPVAPPVPAPVAPQTWFALHASWLTHGIAGIFMIASVALIVLLALQTTKQEGLTGSIGGRVESAYHGRLGADEQLKRVTGVVAVVFVVAAFVLSLTGI